MTHLQSTLDAIDRLAVHRCGHCDQQIRDDGPSLDYCDDLCQYQWHQAREGLQRLVGYREPIDLAAHVDNQVELTSPETRPAAFGEVSIGEVSLAPIGTHPDEQGNTWRSIGTVVSFELDDPVGQVYDPTQRFERTSAAFVEQRLLTDWQRQTIAAWLSEPPTASEEQPDPMQRALELRRTRNTGPTPGNRAPRRIDPRRTR